MSKLSEMKFLVFYSIKPILRITLITYMFILNSFSYHHTLVQKTLKFQQKRKALKFKLLIETIH